MTRLMYVAVMCLTLFSTFLQAAPVSVNSFVSPAIHAESPPAILYGGCLKGDCFNGYGTYVYPNGNKYAGDFKSGNPDGNGILYFANGNKYLGSWQNSYREGDGKFIYTAGHEYVGQFRKDKFHGKGLMKYANGDSYDGNWQSNQPNGFGKYAFHTGDRYEGNFQDGKFNGAGSMFYKNGSKFSGLWRENKKHGKGTFSDPSGKTTSGEWVNGRPVSGAGNANEDAEILPASPVKDGDSVQETPAAGKTAPAATSSSVRIWAVVVGVATYTHMPSLHFTDDDAYQFYAFLKSPEGGALPDEQMEVLVDDSATRDNILQALRSVFQRADENDVVLFYYSGHGIEGAFIPVDFDGVNYRLYHEDIRQILDQSRAKYKLVLGDACNSGSLYGMNSKADILAARAPVRDMLDRYYKAFENCDGGLALLMSSKDKEVSLEDSGLRSGVFSHYVIRGLKGEADFNNDKIVTIKELSEFVTKKVSTYTARAQTPVLMGKFDQNMPVSVVRH